MKIKMNIQIIFVNSYEEPEAQKRKIYQDNLNKSGVYLWTNKISLKSYVGSSINMAGRFRSYFSKYYLERSIKSNNSLIYKALLKYGYSNFKLDILEYCDKGILLEREQFYLDTLELKYNVLKTAGSLLGFKHNARVKELIRKSNTGRICSEEVRLKLSANSQAFPLIIKNLSTQETRTFPSIRRAACFINIHPSYLAKCLRKKNFYQGKGYYVRKATAI